MPREVAEAGERGGRGERTGSYATTISFGYPTSLHGQAAELVMGGWVIAGAGVHNFLLSCLSATITKLY